MFPLHCSKVCTAGGRNVFFTYGNMLVNFSVISFYFWPVLSLKRRNSVDKGTVHYFAPGFAFLEWPCLCQLQEEQQQTGMPCFANTAIVGGVSTGETRTEPGWRLQDFLFFSAKCSPSDGTDHSPKFYWCEITCRFIKAMIQVCSKSCSNQIVFITMASYNCKKKEKK